MLSLDHDTSAHHDLESVSISFEQTSIDVSVSSHGEEVDNVGDSVLDDLDLLREVDRVIEETQELSEGSVVHPLDVGHLDDTEVEHGTSGGDGSEELSLLVDINGLISCFSQFLSDILRFGLDVSKHIDEFDIIKE